MDCGWKLCYIENQATVHLPLMQQFEMFIFCGILNHNRVELCVDASRQVSY